MWWALYIFGTWWEFLIKTKNCFRYRELFIRLIASIWQYMDIFHNIYLWDNTTDEHHRLLWTVTRFLFFPLQDVLPMKTNVKLLNSIPWKFNYISHTLIKYWIKPSPFIFVKKGFCGRGFHLSSQIQQNKWAIQLKQNRMRCIQFKKMNLL